MALFVASRPLITTLIYWLLECRLQYMSRWRCHQIFSRSWPLLLHHLQLQMHLIYIQSKNKHTRWLMKYKIPVWVDTKQALYALSKNNNWIKLLKESQSSQFGIEKIVFPFSTKKFIIPLLHRHWFESLCIGLSSLVHSRSVAEIYEEKLWPSICYYLLLHCRFWPLRNITCFMGKWKRMRFGLMIR